MTLHSEAALHPPNAHERTGGVHQVMTCILLVLAAWAASSALLLIEHGPGLAETLPDADDAMRLVEVREFLAGRAWFDMHEPRLGLLAGYDSHWSRLIDAGLAGLYLLVRPFAGNIVAEQIMVAVWPPLWMLVAIAAVAAIAWRLAGREAALIVLLLAMFAGPGVQQFRPGRIDHHNAQIALSLLVVAATAWTDRSRAAAWIAGVVSGAMMAIGFEGLPLVAICGAAVACRYTLTGEHGALLRYGLGIALGAVAALLVSTPPVQWFVPACDKIAINSTAALVAAGLGVALLAVLFKPAQLGTRFVAMAVAGLAAVAVFAAIEPRCLGGHYAMVDPAVRPIWLDHVSETKPLTELLGRAPASALATLAFPAIALLSGLALLRHSSVAREFGPLTALVVFIASIVFMFVAVRGTSYAVWLGMPFIAAGALRLFQTFRIDNLAVRFFVLILLTPTALALGTLTIASAAGQRELTELNSGERAVCTARAQYRPLAALPPGRIAVNEIEWGPYLLAWTPHSVLAAPYHRLAPAILASHRIFASPPGRAHAEAAASAVDYVVLCGSHGATGLSDAERQASLWGRLRAGAVPDWLEPVPGPSGQAFAVYRVKR